MGLSSEAGALSVLVLNAIYGLLAFFERDHASLNLDGLYGLRILQGYNPPTRLPYAPSLNGAQGKRA